MNLLPYGGGAAEGLDEVLKRMMLEEEQQRRNRSLQEETRSNMANEGLRGEQLKQTGETNRLTREALQQERMRQDEDRNLNRKVRTIGIQPIGAAVGPEEKASQMKAGTSSANYFSPILPGRSTPEGDDDAAEGTSYWRGSQDQIERERRDSIDSAPQRGVMFDKVSKKPIDVMEDRKNKRVLLMNGTDVTDRYQRGELEHYEKPTPPAVSILQTDQGLVRVPKAGGEATPVTLAGGGKLGAVLPAQERVRIDTAPKMAAHIDPTKHDIEEMDKLGLIGPVMGRWSDFLANKIGSTGDPDSDYRLGKLAFNMKGLISGFINIHAGARGAASSALTSMWQNILSSDHMSKERLFGALDAEKDWLGVYGTGPQQDQGGGGDIYQEYLNRTKKQ